MSKKFLRVIVLILAVVCVFASCDDNKNNTPNTPENPTHIHTFGEWENKKEATCTAEGSKERYCSCGEKQTASVPATGHSFGSWTTVKEATQTEKGLEERTCSCGEKETRDIDILPVVTTVTKNEWKKAFDFSTANNFSIYVEELSSDSTDNSVYGIKGTLTIKNGTIHRDLIGLWGNEEEVYQDSVEGTIYTFFDIGDYVGEWLWEFGSDLQDEADYGFSLFEYSESSKSYVAWLEIDGQIFCDVNFWFENKQITKITLSGKSEEGELNCTYAFSYNDNK